MKGKNSLVFLLCSLVGYMLGQLLPEGSWAVFVSILVSYHLFLAWLVVTHEKMADYSLPLSSFETILTHLVCLSVVVCIGLGRQYVPFFNILRLLIPAAAPFERDWLFSVGVRKGNEQPQATVKSPIEKVTATGTPTAADHEAWLQYKARNPIALKAGLTVRDEYHQFIAQRIKSRTAEQLNAS